MRKILALALLPFLAYLAWPLASAWQLRSAVKARDLAAIEARVDWPVLRANLKQTVSASLLDENKNRDSGHFTKALKRTLGPLVADRVIDAAVTPKTLASVLAGRSLLDDIGLLGSRAEEAPAGKAGNKEARAPDIEVDPAADPLSPRRLRWAFFESPTRFRIEVVDPKLPGKRVISVLALQGISWKLVDVYYETRA